MSRMPGLMFDATLAKIASCISQHCLIRPISSALLIALSRSMNSVASTNLVVPESPSFSRVTKACGMLPGPTSPMVP